MDFAQLQEFYKNDITLKGRNLENQQDVQFKMLTEQNIDGMYGEKFYFDKINTPKEYEQAKKLEEYMRKIYSSDSLTAVNPLPVKDGKVVLQEGALFHRAIQDKQVIKNIAAGGVLASEWFGKLESAGEGRFCAFLNTVVSKEEVSKQKLTFRSSNIANQHANQTECVFYFDVSNPIMQTLMHMDYFEYERIKRNEPEKLTQIYSPQVIDLMDNLIEPNSPCGKNMHDSPNSPSYDWLAIPGGIPPYLINGICIHSSRQDILEDLAEISRIFPNATIFDENNNVLAQSRANESQHK